MFRVFTTVTAFAFTTGFALSASGQVLLTDDLTDLSGTSQSGIAAGGAISLESEVGNSFLRITQSGPGATLTKFANFGVGVVNPGDEILISFDARGSASNAGNFLVEFFSELSGGGTSATEILGGSPLVNPPADDTETIADFTNFQFTTLAGPDVSGGLTLQLVATGSGVAGSSATFDFDNVAVSIVPEPASLALLGLGGVAVLARRRRDA